MSLDSAPKTQIVIAKMFYNKLWPSPATLLPPSLPFTYLLFVTLRDEPRPLVYFNLFARQLFTLVNNLPPNEGREK